MTYSQLAITCPISPKITRRDNSSLLTSIHQQAFLPIYIRR